MKIKPLDILLDSDFELKNKIFLISGNEITLMECVCSSILNRYNKEKNLTISRVDTIENLDVELGLFESKKIFLGKNCKGVNKENLNKIRENDGIFIFVQENSPKTKQIKNAFSKDSNLYLIDCYELDKESKIQILNKYLINNNIIFEKDIYWMLIDRLDNRFGFLQNTLDKISKLKNDDITIQNIRKILNTDDTGKENLFFSIFNNNNKIVEMYREKILSTPDVNELYYHCKFFCQKIIECETEFEFSKKIPVYLFRQKKFLLELFKRYNMEKKKRLVKLLSQTEIYLRKEGGLSLVTGLRFLLSVKKITVS